MTQVKKKHSPRCWKSVSGAAKRKDIFINKEFSTATIHAHRMEAE